MDEEREEKALLTLSRALSRSSRTVVLTGPGISLDAGVPGLWGGCSAWDSLPIMQYVTLDRIRRKPEKIWPLLLDYLTRIREAEPTSSHCALAHLEEREIIDGIITLTVDDLHKRAGSRQVIACRGTLENLACPSCGSIIKKQDVSFDDLPPRCSCGETLIPHIAFGNSLLSDAMGHHVETFLQSCQLLLCIGISESSPPVSRMIQSVLSGGGKVIILQPGFTSLPDSPTSFHLPFSSHRLLPHLLERVSSPAPPSIPGIDMKVF